MATRTLKRLMGSERGTAESVKDHKAGGDPVARQLALHDQRTEVGEVNVDPALTAKLLAINAIRDPKGIKLSEADLAALDQKPSEVMEVPSRVDEVLADNGMTMVRGLPDRKRLGLDVLRAEVAAYDAVLARRSGDPTPTPERPPVLTPPPPGKTLSQVREFWTENKAPKTTERDDNRIYVDAFISVHGDVPVKDVTRAMVREFRELLRKRPRNMSTDVAKWLLREQVTWGTRQKDCRLLSPRTINAKGVGSLFAIMDEAISESLIQVNPCARQFLPIKDGATDRLPFDKDDLTGIFTSVIYANGERYAGGGGEAQFWFELIGLFEGPRLEEIGQLLTDDVKVSGKIDYISFTEIDDEAETAGTKPQRKRQKTPNARRDVPVHPFLIELGFLRYVARMKAQGHKRLFPDLIEYDEKLTRKWSRWFGRFLRKHVTKSRRKVFHSLRHAFVDALRNIKGVTEDDIRSLIGHKKTVYRHPIGLERRYEIICQLQFPEVDFSLVRAAAARPWGVANPKPSPAVSRSPRKRK